jgi:hypothetical protein
MAGRIKIKSKVVKSTLQNKDVIDMFHNVIGTDGASISIIHPKYTSIEKNTKRFIQVLEILYNIDFLEFFNNFKENLDMYLFSLRRQFASSFTAPDLEQYLSDGNELVSKFSPMIMDYSRVPAHIVHDFNSVYGEVKKCAIINTIIVTCKNLVPHKKSIDDIKDLKDKFLLKGGLNFSPLPTLIFNFKQIYIDDRLSENNKDFILKILHKLYTISHEIYEILSSPDIDVNEFVTIIMSSIDDVKKQIPRCDQAFNKIAESVDLLKGNFNGYYKDYISSNNPTIIMENFVLDVSKNTRASPTLTAQFRKIISHYKKIAAQQSNNPKLQTLFQQVDKNFQELEKQKQRADAGESDSDDSDEDSENDKEMTEEEMKTMEDGLSKAMENMKEKNPSLSGMIDKLTQQFGTNTSANDSANASATASATDSATASASEKTKKKNSKKLTKTEQKKINKKKKIAAAKKAMKAAVDETVNDTLVNDETVNDTLVNDTLVDDETSLAGNETSLAGNETTLLGNEASLEANETLLAGNAILVNNDEIIKEIKAIEDENEFIDEDEDEDE